MFVNMSVLSGAQAQRACLRSSTSGKPIGVLFGGTIC
jgi:hypothetical protein